MASMEEIIGQLDHAINELERNAAGLAYQAYEPLAQSIHALNGVPAGEQAMRPGLPIIVDRLPKSPEWHS